MFDAETKPLVSFGKHEPPYAGPALKNLPPILLSGPIEKYLQYPLHFSHKFANSFIYVIFVAKKAFEAYLINSAPLLDVVKNLALYLLMENKVFSL